jgi:hypothetical protein
MKTRNLLAILAISAGFAFIGTSCTNENSVATDAALSATASDEAQASSLSDAVISNADSYVNALGLSGFSNPSLVKGVAETSVTLPTITIDKKDSISFPKTITIDFGTTGLIDWHGDTIKGKIIVTIDKMPWKTGATKTIKLVDFYINGNNIKGIKTVVNNGLNDAKNPNVTVTVSDTIIRVDKSTIIRNSTRTRERINDGGTPKVYWDDEFSITGSATGINSKGVAYTIKITNPLIIWNNYPHFVKGTVSASTQNRTAVLDYGDGTKDNKATLTINGVSKDIILRH